jgi:hypothetical protein
MRSIFAIFIILVIFITINQASGLDYEFAYDEYRPGGSLRQYHDLKQLNFTVLNVEKFFIPKWINEPRDYSDILKVKFNVTNNGLENFSIYKNMFQIDVIENHREFKGTIQTNRSNIVDNYYPQYIEDFKLRFQDISLPSELSECVLLNHGLRINQTKTLSVCFDVRQKWSNEPMDLDGPRQYYLVMMDNKFASSCPNCKSVLINNYYQNPIMKAKLPPLIQIGLGISADRISCRDGFDLIFKNPESPVCVTPATGKILENRGWIRDK